MSDIQPIPGQLPAEATLRQLPPRRVSEREFGSTKIRVEKAARIAHDLRSSYSEQRTQEIRHAEARSRQGETAKVTGYQEIMIDTRGYTPEKFHIRHVSETGQAISEEVIMFKQTLPDSSEQWLQLGGNRVALNADLYETRLDSNRYMPNDERKATVIPWIDGRGAYLGIATILEAPAPMTAHLESHEHQTEIILNERITAASSALVRMDRAVETVQIDARGKIISTLHVQPETPEMASFNRSIETLQREYRIRNETALAQVKATPGILDAALINGAIVVTYDSSTITTPVVILGYGLDAKSPRGEHHEAKDTHLGLIMVDINPAKRENGTVPPSRSVVHELRHHNASLIAYAIGQDSQVRMASAIMNPSSSALYGKGFPDVPKRGMIRRDAIMRDADKYKLLLGRDFTPADLENITTQRHYLDELHSSFLERKLEWMNSKVNVYNNMGSGKHWELVGSNPADQQATRELLTHMQGAFLLDQYVFTDAPHVPDSLKPLIPQWKDFYLKIGGIIGSSLTVHQASVLVAEAWQDFKSQIPRLFSENQAAFPQLISHFENQGVAFEPGVIQLFAPLSN